MIKDIKKFYHITSKTLSIYTESSLDLINSIINNRRTLSPQILARLMPLYKALSKKVPIENLKHAAIYLKKESIDSTVLKTELQNISYALEKKQHKLEKIRSNRSHALRGLHACILLIENPNTSIKDINWLVLRKKQLEYILSVNTHTHIYLLENTIKGLKTRVSALKLQINNSKIETN